MSISNIYEIGKRSLLSHQSAINTTAGNIANVNREGYIRRRINLASLTDGLPHLGKVGLTVTSDEIQRMRQVLAENQLWSENQDLGKYERSETILTQLEGIFAEPTDAGLNNVMNEFWDAWNDLANQPESQTARTVVRDKGVMLANTFNRINGEYKQMSLNMQSEIKGNVTRINQLLGKISQINEQITTSNSIDLLDQRDNMLTELSKELNVKITEQASGEVSISLDGLILINGSELNTLKANFDNEQNPPTATVSINNVNYQPKISSGALSSLLETHNTTIPEVLKKMDILAVELASKVNQIHNNGANLADITGINFFSSDITGAADFRVDDGIRQDASLIASKYVGGGSGDGSMAQAMNDLRYNALTDNLSPTDFYTSILGDVGNKVQEASFMRESQEMIVQQLETQKQSVSGVSIDEEMTRMVQYQQAYEAAAKVMTTVDEMVSSLLSMV